MRGDFAGHAYLAPNYGIPRPFSRVASEGGTSPKSILSFFRNLESDTLAKYSRRRNSVRNYARTRSRFLIWTASNIVPNLNLWCLKEGQCHGDSMVSLLTSAAYNLGLIYLYVKLLRPCKRIGLSAAIILHSRKMLNLALILDGRFLLSLERHKVKPTFISSLCSHSALYNWTMGNYLLQWLFLVLFFGESWSLLLSSFLCD